MAVIIGAVLHPWMVCRYLSLLAVKLNYHNYSPQGTNTDLRSATRQNDQAKAGKPNQHK